MFSKAFIIIVLASRAAEFNLTIQPVSSRCLNSSKSILKLDWCLEHLRLGRLSNQVHWQIISSIQLLGCKVLLLKLGCAWLVGKHLHRKSLSSHRTVLHARCILHSTSYLICGILHLKRLGVWTDCLAKSLLSLNISNTLTSTRKLSLSRCQVEICKFLQINSFAVGNQKTRCER